MTVTASNPNADLTNYAHTYVQEEVRAEALTRNIGGFSRFLEIAARQNGQVTNTSGIARDAAVTRQMASKSISCARRTRDTPRSKSRPPQAGIVGFFAD